MNLWLSETLKEVVGEPFVFWQKFVKGKRSKKDIQKFQLNLMDNILSLHRDLSNHIYKHGPYQEFRVHDPKPRIIHKATIRDRLLHHAAYRILYPFFERIFISDSFSCRVNKGPHKAINRFREFSHITSKNNAKTCQILQRDIQKFFHSIDQQILIEILNQYISDSDIVSLLRAIIESFDSGQERKGLPLGNLTSQLFCNIYMNEFDQFVKHKLKAKHYIRYADDFVVLSEDKEYLKIIITKIESFLEKKLKLNLHKDKIFIKTLSSGIDFLGWVNFFGHRVLRTKTKNKMFKKLSQNNRKEVLQSYLGLISHGNAYKIKNRILKANRLNLS